METKEKQISAANEEESLQKSDDLKTEVNHQEQVKSSEEALAKVQAELEEMKRKYQEKEDECLIAKQKQETTALLEASNMPTQMLEVVYTPKDMEATKTKIQILKNYIEELVNAASKNDVQANQPLPLISSGRTYNDPFLEGFLSA